jgi:hypothetical protein
VFLVTITCSDPACTEEREIAVQALDEVDELPCDCGFGFILISVSGLAA